MKRLFIILTIAFAALTAQAQSSALYYMTNLRQSIYTNPARLNCCTFSFSLPSMPISFTIFSQPLTFSSIFSKGVDKYYIDFRKMSVILQNSPDDTYFMLDNRFDLLSFGIRVHEWYFHYSYSLNDFTVLHYPKPLIYLLGYGNAGEYSNVDLSNFSLNSTVYLQHAFTLGYEVSDKLSVGASLKFNKGIFNFSTNEFVASASFDTSYANNYPVTINAQYNFNISGPLRIYYYNPDSLVVQTVPDLSDSLTMKDSLKVMLKNMFLHNKNSGLAVDLGIIYKPIPQVELSASIIDLGYIKWRMNPTTIKAEADQVVFSGVDALDSAKTQAILDTFKSQIKPALTYEPYKTSLYYKIYLGAAVRPLYFLTLGFHYRGTRIEKHWYNVYTAGLYLNPGYKWSFALNYSWYPNRTKTLGAGMSLDLGIMQLYMLMDNLALPRFALSYFTNKNTPPDQNAATIKLKDSRLFNFMIGINFSFDCKDRRDFGLLD